MAYDFDGTNDAISLGNSSALNPTSFSVSLWANIDTFHAQDWMFARDDDALGRSYAFGFLDTGHAGLQVNGTNTAYDPDAATIGVWYNFGVTGTNGSFKVYRDGSSVNTATNALTPNSTTGNTTIGQRTYAGNQGFIDGRIAEVGFWNVVLTADEMAALAKGYSPLLVRSASLIAYVPLVRDLVNLKANGSPSLVDAPTVAAHPRIIYPKRRA